MDLTGPEVPGCRQSVGIHVQLGTGGCERKVLIIQGSGVSGIVFGHDSQLHLLARNHHETRRVHVQRAHKMDYDKRGICNGVPAHPDPSAVICQTRSEESGGRDGPDAAVGFPDDAGRERDGVIVFVNAGRAELLRASLEELHPFRCHIEEVEGTKGGGADDLE